MILYLDFTRFQKQQADNCSKFWQLIEDWYLTFLRRLFNNYLGLKFTNCE